MATWTQALDNVRTGGVRLKNNVPFTVAKFYSHSSGEKFTTLPDIVLKVNNNNIANESRCEFKDGGYFGIEYINTDARINFALFVNIPDYEVIGQTERGTPYTWIVYGTMPLYFTVNIGGNTVPVYYRDFALSFAIPVNSSGGFDPYVMWYVVYPTRATNETYMYEWNVNYNEDLPWSTFGEFGQPQDNSHVVDFLAGDSNPATEYPSDPSTTGGGNGSFIYRNEEVLIPPEPDLQAIDFGFNTIYSPLPEDTITTMQRIATWLWSDDFDENIKMNYISPFDNILAIAIVPTNVVGSTRNAIMRIGNVDSDIGTLKVIDQFKLVDCGVLDMDEVWGGFLDYNATYTIWLPYIGYRSMKSSDVMNCKLNIVYRCDCLTGAITCWILSYNKTTDGNNELWHVLYTYTGNMFYNVAFSGANFMSLYNQQLSATTSGINNAVQSLGQIASGNILGGVAGLFTGQAEAKRQDETAKPEYGRGGNGGGNSGFFAHRKPYIVESLPIASTPKNYKSLQGIPSQIFAKLSTLTGYTEIESANVSQLTNCTDSEKDEILTLLKGGVYL